MSGFGNVNLSYGVKIGPSGSFILRIPTILLSVASSILSISSKSFQGPESPGTSTGF